MNNLRSDVRLALRRLRKAPGFTIAALATLALAIGANTTVFTALNGIVFRPLPGVERAQDLVFLNNTRTIPAHSYPNYVDIRDRSTVFAGVMGYRFAPMSLGASGGNARLWGYLATGNYFDVLGVRAFHGRLLTPADDRTVGTHPVAVLAYSTWQRRFGGDLSIVDRAIKINGLDYTVIGIAPPGFRGTELFFAPEIWVPLTMQPQIEARRSWLDRRETKNLLVVARLKPGVTLARARASIDGLAAQLAREHPSINEGMTIPLSPPGLAGNVLRGPVIGFAGVLMGVAGLVLLIACTNLASLLLARGSDRGREVAIRLACGATRGRILRLLLTESLVLALCGGAAGLALAVWLTDLFAAWRPPIDFPISTDLVLDGRVFVFTLLLTMAATVMFGLVPARRASRVDVTEAIKNRGAVGRVRGWPLRDLLVGVQVALSALLVVGAVLVVRSLQQSFTLDLGFRPAHAVTVSFDLGLEDYSRDHAEAFERRVLDRVSALPGVQAAGLISTVPLSLNRNLNTVVVDGRPVPRASEQTYVATYDITPGALAALGTRLLAGRDVDARDRRDTPRVALVNRTFARQLLPGTEALGQRFRLGGGTDAIEIVGIVEDGKYIALGEAPMPAVFLPLWQGRTLNPALVVRSASLAEGDMLRAVRQAVLDLDPALALYDVGSLTRHLELPLFPARLAAFVLGLFGALAIVLAATGVYGVMAYAVARRTREIGIRVAIGATPQQVLRLVVGRLAILLGVSVTLGLLLAIPFAQVLTRITYGVDARDPATFGFALLVMLSVAAGACWWPLRTASSIDPVRALRDE